MSYSITCSTKILTLPILFISVDVLCEFVMVCTFYCPLRKKRSTLLLEGDVQSSAHSSKRFKPLSALILLLLCYDAYNWTK